jgi:hypothetical protein
MDMSHSPPFEGEGWGVVINFADLPRLDGESRQVGASDSAFILPFFA